MPILSYCYVSIFGSALDVEGLKNAIGDPNATTATWRRRSPDSRSSVPAIRVGNVREWKSAKEYYVQTAEMGSAAPVWDYTAEEEHIRRCLKRWMPIGEVLPQFRTETTEVWLHLVYRADAKERPTGVFFSKDLLDSVHELGASISTDVAFDK